MRNLRATSSRRTGVACVLFLVAAIAGCSTTPIAPPTAVVNAPESGQRAGAPNQTAPGTIAAAPDTLPGQSGRGTPDGSAGRPEVAQEAQRADAPAAGTPSAGASAAAAPAPAAREARAPITSGASAPTATRADGPTRPAAPVAAGALKPAPAADASAARTESTPRPDVVAAPVVPPPPDDLWDRIRAGFALPELNTPLVAEKERFYLSKPEYLQRMMQRGGRYLHYIVEEIERRGMPTEIALLPFVESAMNPGALSSAQAAGLWQFIPSTGKAYNLNQNWWVDNRRDVVKSTHAALDYLQKIYAMHGNDWFLALASYNWGEGAVGRAVKKNQAKGLGTHYLDLNMPAETRNYIPKLIALKNVIQRADELKLTLPALPNRPYFATIEKTRPIDLKLAAKFAGMSVEEFVALNPAHNRPVISATKNNEIKLPADRVDAFLAAVEQHGEANRVFASWQPHTIGPAETLATVAARGGVSESELRRANSLAPSQRILAGTRIIAPHPAVTDELSVERFVAPRVYESVSRSPLYHTVGKRDSAPSIAARYKISEAMLNSLNDLRNGVRRGMRLLIRKGGTQTLLTDENGGKQVIANSPAATPERGAAARRKTGAKSSPKARSPARSAAASGAGQPAAKVRKVSHEPTPKAKSPGPRRAM